ncbi:MAG TPA: S8 family serine peptidase [Gaiellaceae bacterium]|nr:S8 family serine peptidase [Gaiellaceae bacterium]
MLEDATRQRSDLRSSALWRKGGRRAALALALCAALLAPAAASAGNGNGAANGHARPAYLPGTLLADAAANPGERFDVIVELKPGGDENDLTSEVRGLGVLRHRFASIDGVAARLPGAAIVQLARRSDLLAITRDAPVQKTDFAPAQVWQSTVGAEQFWPTDPTTCAVDPQTGLQTDPSCAPSPGIVPPAPPAIAIVDSGIDTSRAADFGDRVIDSEALSSLAPGETGDGAGHGTFVASIAAGSSTTYPGVAPTAPLVNLRVMDDQGEALTSDVIAAADWILLNRERLDIRVANFSLLSSTANSFKFDPLDHAVERLWLAGVTVVAAAGNQGNGTRLPMDFAPANDPFAITVGALWTHDTQTSTDDDVAPFSAYGYTADGFAKPELSAPGRYMTGAVSPGTYLYTAKADRIVEPGYLNISGTSFAAPVVAGAAADLLAQHPDWTPDEVKGALMETAQPIAASDPIAGGVGEVDIPAANALQGTPPNPNAGLDRFVVADATSAAGRSFDDDGWNAAAASDPSWNAISWDSISWDSISWDSISWDSVSWDSISWDDSSQAESSLAEISWDEASDAN